MDFQTFVEEVKAEVQRICPDKKVVVQDIFKNNDTKLTGMTLLDEGKRLSPTMYLEKYYDDFLSVGIGVEAIANNIFAEWERHSKDIDYTIINSLYLYETMKDKLALKLINKNMNMNRLEHIPYNEYLDEFALICYIDIELETDDETSRGSINITDGLLEVWNISKEEMFKQAYDNTKNKCEPLIQNMNNVMIDIAKRNGVDEPELESVINGLNKCDTHMIVLSNKTTLHGAVMIVFNDVMEELAEQIGHSFYMIPSSIHEWIIVDEPISKENTSVVKHMLVEVNESEVNEQEVLSNNLYMYDYDSKQIRVAE